MSPILYPLAAWETLDREIAATASDETSRDIVVRKKALLSNETEGGDPLPVGPERLYERGDAVLPRYAPQMAIPGAKDVYGEVLSYGE